MAKAKAGPKKAATKSTPRARRTIVDQLRELIESRDLTAYALGKEAEVDPAVIARFVSGERGIQFETAGRLAAALGLRLVEVERKARRKA